MLCLSHQTMRESIEHSIGENKHLLIVLFCDRLSAKGRVSRAVSLCIFNKIHMAQLYWPETAGTARVSIPHHANSNRSPSATAMTVLKTNCLNSTVVSDNEGLAEQASALLEISEEQESALTSEHCHDGLMSLDENLLNELVETDLVSSSNG